MLLSSLGAREGRAGADGVDLNGAPSRAREGRGGARQ